MVSHLVSRQPWGVVDLDLEKGHVFVRQDWRYRWRFQMVMRPWSDAEKWAFHRAVDRQVWRSWSMRVRLMVSSRTPGATSSIGQTLARTCGSRGLTLSFDVRRVEVLGHWEVSVLKASLEKEHRASVDFSNRQ